MREKGRLARFKGYKAEPSRSRGLADDHPAVVEGRTLFPGTVIGTWKSRNFLIDGENSGKIGRIIEKGAWAGMPTFTLTLEERATCPRECHIYEACFGNSMQWARRNDAFDPDFLSALKAEVVTLVRRVCAPNIMKPKWQPPKGIVIRLHVLGDFFSVAYVKAWAEMMAMMPELHVFGYTARGMFPADGDMSIATEIKKLNDLYPDRWVIRWSSDAAGPMRTIVVDEDPNLPNVIVCPQEKEQTETCSSCALCWSPAAKEKTIAFIRHGIKVGGGALSRPGKVAARNSGRVVEMHEALKRLQDEKQIVTGRSIVDLADQAGLALPTARRAMWELKEGMVVQVIREAARARTGIYKVFDRPQEVFPPAPPAPLPTRKAAAPRVRDVALPVKKDAVPVRERKPDEPLMAARPHAHTKGGWHGKQTGTAADYDIGTPDERIAQLDAEEKQRIAATYGAEFKKETP